MPRYIDADELKAYMCSVCENREQCKDRGTVCSDIADIDEMSTADVEPVRHGRWVCVEAEPEKVWCDYCKTDYRSSDLLNIGADDEKVIFCLNCGAKMDGGDGNENK